MLSNRASRIMAAAATAGLMFAGIAPATASAADSSAFATSTTFSAAGSSNQEDVGTVSYAAVGGIEDGVQVGDPFDLSMRLVNGSLGGNSGGGGNGGGNQPPTLASGDLLFNCDGSGLAYYNNIGVKNPTTFRLTRNGSTVNTSVVPADDDRNVPFSGLTEGDTMAITADGVTVISGSFNPNDCY